ncbi:MAG: DUF3574 domain-containing protein [Pseudomonadota bacterium]|jgi:hypothetical protein|nr:DUF3574 domain-containing protein [Pseudomonadota bacterium]
MLLRLALAAILPLLSACVTAMPVSCAGGAAPKPVAELVFGRNIGGRLGVGERDWRAFLDTEVTPRFPDGFTVLDARGQWRDAGAIVREPSKVLVIALQDEARDRAEIAAVAEAYKARFRQQSVLTMVRQACVSF